MNLPRDLAGSDLAFLLRRYGYAVTRQTGSHLRLSSTRGGAQHHVTIPSHKALKVGTLSSIVTEVARALEMDRNRLADELFARN